MSIILSDDITLSMIKNGVNGVNGIGIKSIVEQYYLSTSNEDQAGGTWEITPPVWESNHYIWTRSEITWEDNEVTHTTPVLANGLNGANENASSAISKANETKQNLDGLTTIVEENYETLQGQIDGSISTWFYSYEPSNDKDPEVNWTTVEIKNQHLGDLFYIVDNEEKGGQCYRYAKIDNDYQWVLVEDVDVAKALSDAAAAQATANGKSTIYVGSSDPVSPREGDLWMQSPNSDIKTYVDGSWTKYNKYTDDTIANQAKGIADTAKLTADDAKTTADTAHNEVQNTVNQVDVEYYLSESATELIGGEWKTTAPPWADGKYIWSRQKMTFVDSNKDPEYGDPACITGGKGATGDKGEQGIQGYGIVTSVSKPSFTETSWNNYGTIGRSETWSETTNIRNGCRIGDIFTVVGTATDTGNAHVLYFRSTTDIGNLVGTCLSHSITYKGDKGDNSIIYTLEIDNPARRYANTATSQGSNKKDTITYTISPISLGIQFFKIDGTSKEVYTPGANDVTVIYSTREQVSNSISGYLSGPTNNKYSFNLDSFYTNVIKNVLNDITNSDSIDISIDGLISFYEGDNLLGSFEIKDAQPDEELKHLITAANIQTSIDNNKMVFDTNGLTLYNGAFKIARATISNGQISSPTDLFYYDTTNTSLYIKTDYARIGNWRIGGSETVDGKTYSYPDALYNQTKTIWLSPNGISTTINGNAASMVFKAGGRFGVDTSGNLYAFGGKIGGWKFTTSYIYSTQQGSNAQLQLCSSEYTQEGSWIIGINEDFVRTFEVTKKGILKAKEAEISGHIEFKTGRIGGTDDYNGWTIDENYIGSVEVLSDGNSGKSFIMSSFMGNQGYWIATRDRFGNTVFEISKDGILFTANLEVGYDPTQTTEIKESYIKFSSSNRTILGYLGFSAIDTPVFKTTNGIIKKLVYEETDGYIYSNNEKVWPRIYSTLVPWGTLIPEDANLNTLQYLKVGNYYCNENKKVATLKNCPLTTYNSEGEGVSGQAFMMQVYSPLSTVLDTEETGTWLYRIRKITHYNTGIEYIQYCYVGATAGNWTYGDWYIKPRSKFTFNKTAASTAAIGSNSKPIYINSAGEMVAGSSYAGGTAITLNGSSKSGTAATFYAPTAAGSNGQVLTSTGGAPVWKNQSDIVTKANVKIALGTGSGTTKYLREDGTWQVPYTLPTASSSTLGGVKIGSNISLSSGTISLTKANVIGALEHTPLSAYNPSGYDLDTCYDAGLYMISSGTNCPSGSSYGSLLSLPYRKATDNEIPDFGTQIFIPNGDDKTKPNSMFYRTSLATSWNNWQEVVALGNGTNGIRKVVNPGISLATSNVYLGGTIGDRSRFYSNIGLVIINLIGILTGSMTANQYYKIGTVPSGYRPIQPIALSIYCRDNSSTQFLMGRIRSGGEIEVKINESITANHYIIINGAYIATGFFD